MPNIDKYYTIVALFHYIIIFVSYYILRDFNIINDLILFIIIVVVFQYILYVY